MFSPPNPRLSPHQQCGSVVDGGELRFLEKSGKRMLRMGRVGSDDEDELRLSSRSSTSNKGFKFPKKFTKGDGNTVCHVSVPRKSRSGLLSTKYLSYSPIDVCLDNFTAWLFIHQGRLGVGAH